MTGPAYDLTGLVFPGPPGQGIDHLQALWARDCARRAAEMLEGADEPCAVEVARALKACPEPARLRVFGHPLASLDTGVTAPDGVKDPRSLAERRAALARHLIGAPDIEDLTLVFTGGDLAADLMLPHLRIVLHAPGARVIALRQSGGRVGLMRDDGVSATFGTGIPAPPGTGNALFHAAPRIGGFDVLNADPAVRAALAPFGLAEGEVLHAAMARLAAGLGLMAQVWPAAAETLARHVRGLVLLAPRGYERSHSPQSLCGTIMMTAGAPETVGDLLCHESSHVRMHWVKAVDPLVVATDPAAEAAGFDSPWRSDKRPLDGLLLGVHAFLNVCAWYDRLAARGGASARFARGVLARQAANTRQGWRVLSDNGTATPAGAGLMEDLRQAVEALPKETAHA